MQLFLINVGKLILIGHLSRVVFGVDVRREESSVSYGRVSKKYHWNGVSDGMCYITVQKLRLRRKAFQTTSVFQNFWHLIAKFMLIVGDL